MNVRMMIRLTAPVVATSLLLLAVAVGAAWHVHYLEQSISDGHPHQRLQRPCRAKRW